MKIRRSARTILATLLVLAVFTSLTAWHNKTSPRLSDPETQDLIKQLSHKNPKLPAFINTMKRWDKAHSFYVMGTDSQNTWPGDIFRACYSDPLAAWSMAYKLPKSGSAKIDLIRYRSVEDFLVILNEAEAHVPGILSTFNFQQYLAIPEPSFVLSLRLLLSIIAGVLGLILVKHFY